MDTKEGDKRLTMKKEQKKREKKERKKQRKKKRQGEDSDNKNQKKDSNDPQNPAARKKKRQRNDETTTLPSHHQNNNNPQQHQHQRHPFEVDEADHCETPRRAYQDIIPVLDQIAEACGKDRRDLIIYDPYYCDGRVQRHLTSLGCHNVINRNRDFYHDIATGQIPRHDVLLSNPPYSGSHLELLLKFVSQNYSVNTPQQSQHKSVTPFLLLLPHYVYTKSYFQAHFDSDARGREGSHHSGTCNGTGNSAPTNNQNRQLFYLVPKGNYRYAYEPPAWVSVENGSTALARGKTQTAPFPSFWYCHVASLMTTTTAEQQQQQQQSVASKSWLVQTFGQSGQHHSSTTNNNASNMNGRLHYANCTSHLPREFKGEFDVTNKRPNPRARKRAAAKKTVQQHQQQHTTSTNSKKRAPPNQAGNGGKRKKKRY